MSATCESCGASLPEDADACAACGAPLPRVHETAADPAGSIRYDVATTRWFGVAPATVLLALAVAAAVAALVLFATGRWPLGLIVTGAALLFLAAFGEVAKRKPDTTVARRSIDAFRSARERAGVALETAAARSRTTRELNRIRNELFGIQERRRRAVVELGEAALADDVERMTAVKAEIGELDRLAAEKEAEMEAIAERARAGIAQARLSVQETQMVEPDEITTPESAADRRDG